MFIFVQMTKSMDNIDKLMYFSSDNGAFLAIQLHHELLKLQDKSKLT